MGQARRFHTRRLVYTQGRQRRQLRKRDNFVMPNKMEVVKHVRCLQSVNSFYTCFFHKYTPTWTSTPDCKCNFDRHFTFHYTISGYGKSDCECLLPLFYERMRVAKCSFNHTPHFKKTSSWVSWKTTEPTTTLLDRIAWYISHHIW